MMVVEVDLRVSGAWRYGMIADGGLGVAFHGEYLEIVHNERIVSTEVYEGAPQKCERQANPRPLSASRLVLRSSGRKAITRISAVNQRLTVGTLCIGTLEDGMLLEDRVALITGAASGMGREAAKLFAEHGAHIVAADRDTRGLETLVQEFGDQGDRCRIVTVDISHEASVAKMVEQAHAQWGRIDVLFNNAAIGPSSTNVHRMANVVETPESAWDAILSINLKGPALVCKHVIPVMVEGGGGSIINNSSISGIIAVTGADAYTASKGGLVALTRVMASDWVAKGIRVNCICPGPVDTPMNAPWLADAEKEKFLVAGCPMGRVARPEEIASVALFLASDLASYVNGAIIPIDGGWTAL